MSSLQRLPLGIQSFKNIRANGELYVDKTRYLPELRKMGGVVFCSRPRRFGKSLTVSALEAFYSGEKDLFRGLAAEKAMNAPGFEARPVIKLDMSAIANFTSRKEFNEELLNRLRFVAENLGVPLRSSNPSSAFSFMMPDIAKKGGNPVVVLIDEYDAPLFNSLSNPRMLEEVREVMRGFYAQLKVASEYIHFAFITGVSKFSRMGVFSSLNNLCDISVEPEYASMMGYTHEEFKAYFKPYLEGLAKKTGIAEAELPEKIKEYYNGFSFDGETRVYNPFSTLSLFSLGSFKNYWMESGSTTFIRNFLKGKDLTVDKFRNFPVERAFLTSPGEIESTSPQGFLYQAGYLTLRKHEGEYSLDYPNFEVLSAMEDFRFRDMLREEDAANELYKNVRSVVAKQDAVALVMVFNRLFAFISYDDHRKNVDASAVVAKQRALAVGKSCDPKGLCPTDSNDTNEDSKDSKDESFYRATLQSFLLGAGIFVRVEEHNNLGRSDIVAQYNEKTVIIELKTAVDAGKTAKAAAEAMDQILENEYGNAYVTPLRLGAAVDLDRRRIGAYRYIAPGSSEVVEGKVDVKAARRKSGGESEEDARLVPTRINRLKSLIFSLIFVVECV